MSLACFVLGKFCYLQVLTVSFMIERRCFYLLIAITRNFIQYMLGLWRATITCPAALREITSSDYVHDGIDFDTFNTSGIGNGNLLFENEPSFVLLQSNADINTDLLPNDQKYLASRNWLSKLSNWLSKLSSCHTSNQITFQELTRIDPDSKVHGANMGPTWVLSAPDGPHVGPMNLAIRGSVEYSSSGVDYLKRLPHAHETSRKGFDAGMT